MFSFFLEVSWVGLWCIIVAFPGHAHLLFSTRGGLQIISNSNTPDMWQWKTSIVSRNVDQRVRNRVFECHLSPDWRQMAIENTVSSVFLSRVRRLLSAFFIVAYPV